MPKQATITEWAKHRLLAARDSRAAAEQIERRVIREIYESGDADPAAIAATLGVKNRQRIYAIIDDTTMSDDTELLEPEMPPVAWLRAVGVPQETWDRITDALLERGFATTKDKRQAWHLARGGLDVILVDFSAVAGRNKQPRDVVTVTLVRAVNRDDNRGKHITEFELIGSDDQPRPTRDEELDVHAVAQLAAAELVNQTLR